MNESIISIPSLCIINATVLVRASRLWYSLWFPSTDSQLSSVPQSPGASAPHPSPAWGKQSTSDLRVDWNLKIQTVTSAQADHDIKYLSKNYGYPTNTIRASVLFFFLPSPTSLTVMAVVLVVVLWDKLANRSLWLPPLAVLLVSQL